MAAPGAKAREPALTEFGGMAIDRKWAAGALKVARSVMAAQDKNAEKLRSTLAELGGQELSLELSAWIKSVPGTTVRCVNAIRRSGPAPDIVLDRTSWTTELFSFVTQIVARLGPRTGAHISSTDDLIFAAAHLLLRDDEMTGVFGKGARNTITQKRSRMKRRGWKVW
mgnify:CR=1 FL=1